MLALGLDTATAAITTAVVEVTPDRVVVRAELAVVDPRRHGELLAPQIAELLAAAGVRPADLTAVVAGTGPGPFTGLRIGLATAVAIGHARGIPAYAVCSLDAIAAAAVAGLAGDIAGLAAAAPADGLGPDADGLGSDADGFGSDADGFGSDADGFGSDADGFGSGRLLVATDARRTEIYWAVYTGAGARVAGPAVDRPAVVAGRLADLGVRVAVGDGAHRYAGELGVAVRDQPRYPSAYQLVVLAADRVRSGAPAEPLVPRYLRRPDVARPRPPKQVLPR